MSRRNSILFVLLALAASPVFAGPSIGVQAPTVQIPDSASQLPSQLLPDQMGSGGGGGGDGSQIANMSDYTNELASTNAKIRDLNVQKTDDAVAQIQQNSADQVAEIMKQAQTSLSGMQVQGVNGGKTDGVTVDRTAVPNRTTADQLANVGRKSAKDPLAAALNMDAKPDTVAGILNGNGKGDQQGSGDGSTSSSALSKQQKAIDGQFDKATKGADSAYQGELGKLGSDSDYNKMVNGISANYDKILADQGLGKAVDTGTSNLSTAGPPPDHHGKHGGGGSPAP